MSERVTLCQLANFGYGMGESKMPSLGPYEPNHIYCGECSEMMTALPDDCIDLTITSPPYDALRTYHGYTFDFTSIAAQLYRVTRPGGVVVWVVGDQTIKGSETGTSFRQALEFMELGFNLHDTMIYQKLSGGAAGSNLCYLQSFEYMFVFSKGRPKSINLIYDRKNVVKAGSRLASPGRRHKNGKVKKKRVVTRTEMGRRFNIWSFYTGGERSEHPAIFPEALARDHILSWSIPGDLVLDPLVGSGTVPKMCVLTSRHYLGFDISQDYVGLARKRVGQAQPPLF